MRETLPLLVSRAILYGAELEIAENIPDVKTVKHLLPELDLLFSPEGELLIIRIEIPYVIGTIAIRNTTLT